MGEGKRRPSQPARARRARAASAQDGTASAQDGAEAARDATGAARRESGRARQRRQQKAAKEESPLYRLKVEGAQALGLWEKVQADGWGALSAAESGRVGGYVTRCLRLARQEQAPPDEAHGG